MSLIKKNALKSKIKKGAENLSKDIRVSKTVIDQITAKANKSINEDLRCALENLDNRRRVSRGKNKGKLKKKPPKTLKVQDFEKCNKPQYKRVKVKKGTSGYLEIE